MSKFQYSFDKDNNPIILNDTYDKVLYSTLSNDDKDSMIANINKHAKVVGISVEDLDIALANKAITDTIVEVVSQAQADLIAKGLLLIEIIKESVDEKRKQARADLKALIVTMDDTTKKLFKQAQNKLNDFGAVVINFGKVTVFSLTLANATNITAQVMYMGQTIIISAEVLISEVFTVFFDFTLIAKNLLRATGSVFDEVTKSLNNVAEGGDIDFNGEVVSQAGETIVNSVGGAIKGVVGLLGATFKGISTTCEGFTDSLGKVSRQTEHALNLYNKAQPKSTTTLVEKKDK